MIAVPIYYMLLSGIKHKFYPKVKGGKGLGICYSSACMNLIYDQLSSHFTMSEVAVIYVSW